MFYRKSGAHALALGTAFRRGEIDQVAMPGAIPIMRRDPTGLIWIRFPNVAHRERKATKIALNALMKGAVDGVYFSFQRTAHTPSYSFAYRVGSRWQRLTDQPWSAWFPIAIGDEAARLAAHEIMHAGTEPAFATDTITQGTSHDDRRRGTPRGRQPSDARQRGELPARASGAHDRADGEHSERPGLG